MNMFVGCSKLEGRIGGDGIHTDGGNRFGGGEVGKRKSRYSYYLKLVLHLV
jgi:hypothetical protein